MSTQGSGAMQVEKVLDDLITRLSSRVGPEARAALIEARRLRNVTTRWAAIPPPPDARREMLSRVMDLVSKVGGPKPEPTTQESEPTPTMRVSERPKKPAVRSGFDELPPLEPRARQGVSKSSPAATRMGYDSFTDPGPTPRSPVELEPDSVPPDSLDPPRSSRRVSPHRGPTIAGVPEAFGLGARGAPSEPAARATPAGSFGPEHDTRRPTPHRGATISGIPEASEARAERSSSIPTLAPPPPSEEIPSHEPQPLKPSTGVARLGSIAPPSSGASAAESFRRETLMMGSDAKAQVQSLVDEILGAKPSPASETPPTARPGGAAEPEVSSERDVIPAVLAQPSSRRQTNPLGAALEAPPSSKRGAEPARATMAPGVRSSTPIDGLSTSVSSPRIAAQSNPGALSSTKRSNSPTQAFFTPVPPPVEARAKRASSPTRAFESPVPPRATPGARPAADRTARTMLSPGVVLVHPDSALWQPHAVIAGITVKVLFREPRSGMCTSLVRLAPGAVLPRRRHAASEELLVVSGVATIGTTEIRAGEYCRAEIDTEHDAISTTSGCTLFISGSEHDEFLEES
jgi:quercetin dioxygenase-like cupin family protein